MQRVRVPISSFQYGEVSDSLLMRTDSPVYAQSAQRLENMVVMAEGSIKKRYGLKHIYDYGLSGVGTAQSHLFRFVFDQNEEYIISVEEGKVRCFQLETDGSVTLVETITEDTDTNDLPFDEDYLQQYTTAQYGDVMFICHPLFAPRMLTRTSLTDFEISVFTFDSRLDNNQTYQPYTRFQSQGVTLDPSATTGTGITLTTSSDYWDTGTVITEDIDDGSLVVNNWYIVKTVGTSDFTTVGAHSNAVGQVFKATGVGDNTKTGTVDQVTEPGQIDAIVRYGQNEIEIKDIQSATVATGDVVDELKIRLSVLNPLRTRAGSDVVEVTQLGHGFGGGESITISGAAATGGINTGNINGTFTVGDIIDENTYTYTAGGSASDSEDGGGIVFVTTHAPTADWDEQSWSSYRGYPAAVTFHENRLCFGGTLAEPDSVWMSKIGNFFNFDVGEAADNESIALVAATGDVNEIRYMISNRDLQVFTASSELYIPTYLNQAITPTNAQIRKQTPYGSAFVQPNSIDGATIFVANNGRIVREYLYTDAEDAYTSNAISTLASHLIDDPKCMSVAHSGFGLPDSYAVLTMGNGDAALFSSNRAERRASWTRVTTDGSFCSVICIEDRIFANVYDSGGNLQLCEFTEDVGLDFWLYGAITSDKVDVSDLYEEDDVIDVIVTDGSTQSHLGSFTVNSDDEVDLTAYTGLGFTHAYVGKKFTAKIVTNPIDASMGAGPATGEIRGLANVVVDVKNARSMKVNTRPLVTETGFTGKKEFRVLGYDRNPQITIEQDDPLSLQVNGIVAELVT